MFALGIKNALTLLIPQLVSDCYKWATSDQESDIKASNETTRKKSDTTKITQHMYDFIRAEFVSWRETDFNRLSDGTLCYNHTDFCRYLNQRLGLNKSRSSLAKVYNRMVNRDDLPVGTPIVNVNGG